MQLGQQRKMFKKCNIINDQAAYRKVTIVHPLTCSIADDLIYICFNTSNTLSQWISSGNSV